MFENGVKFKKMSCLTDLKNVMHFRFERHMKFQLSDFHRQRDPSLNHVTLILCKIIDNMGEIAIGLEMTKGYS